MSKNGSMSFLLGMPAGQAVSRFGSGIFFFTLDARTSKVEYLFTRDALRGHTVSKNGSISFFFFFFVVATNLYINLFIKLSLSYSGCFVLIVFNKSRPIKILFCRIYREGEDPLTPTYVTSKHHLAPYC